MEVPGTAHGEFPSPLREGGREDEINFSFSSLSTYLQERHSA